ncbi:hypothetical protein DRN75_02135 [Nanoarchaeota archaeon]|nr:MAG: hypothetical protein DRN75_02135 [Nanoarchaeota archaeon]
MPSEATPRQTFRLDEYTWRKFKAKCRKEGYSASDVLRAFIRQFLAGKISIKDLHPAGTKKGQKLSDLYDQFEEWLQTQKGRYNRHLEKKKQQ